MRKILLVGTTVALSVTITAPSGAAAGPAGVEMRRPPVLQHQSGVAFGTFGTDVVSSPPKADLVDAGHYVSTGQLGRGTYRFDVRFANSACTGAPSSTTGNGTARLVRSDGTVLTGTATETIACGAGADPPRIAVVAELTHGSRDLVGAMVLLSGTRTDNVTPTGTTGPESFAFTATSTAARRIGYWMVDSSGAVHAFGGVSALGNGSSSTAFSHIEPTPSGNGYWLVDTAGRVFAFGDAHTYGNAPHGALLDDSVISLSATQSGHGYWLFTIHGRVIPFGDAEFYGDRHLVGLNGTVVGSAATPSGHGYYLVAADGGVFTFGDAKFRGSMGNTHLNQPVVGLVPTADNSGYWMVAADGGVFAFHAPFLGSMGSVKLARPIIGMVRYGRGYMMVGQDGGIFDFSRKPFFGSLGGSPLAGTVVGATTVE